MISPARVHLALDDKLELLRRLDRYRVWDSLDEERLCLECGKTITGRQILISGGAGAFDPLRANCPTEGCAAEPMDWARPDNPPDDASERAWNEGEYRPQVETAIKPPARPAPAVAEEPEALAHSILYRAWRAFTSERADPSRRDTPLHG